MREQALRPTMHRSPAHATFLSTAAPEGKECDRPGIERTRVIAERALVVVVFCSLSGAFERLRYALLTPSIMMSLTASLLAVSVLLIVVHRAAARRVFADLWPSLLMVAMAAVSATWSVAPGATLRASLALAASSAFAVYVASRFSFLEQIDLLHWALVIVAYCAVAAVLSHSPDAWNEQGLRAWFTSKNHLGRCMSLACIVSTVAFFTPGRRWFPIGAGILCLTVMIASDSRSAMLLTPICAGAFLLLRFAQRSEHRAGRIVAAGVAVVGAMVAIAVWRLEELLLWMGRDPTLSARTILWRLLLERWGERPWVGYGFGAFWRGQHSPGGQLESVLRFYPWHGHNGFLDLALDLGVVGFMAFAVIVLVYGTRALREGLHSGSPWALWPATYIGWFVLSNLTESELVRHESLYWPLYLLAVAHLGSITREVSSIGGGSPARVQPGSG